MSFAPSSTIPTAVARGQRRSGDWYGSIHMRWPLHRRLRRLAPLVVALAACSAGSTPATTASVAATLPVGSTVDPGPGFTIPPPPGVAPPWSVDTSSCADPAAADAPISGTLIIGTTAPQTGDLISMIYAPVLTGFRAAIDSANAAGALGDVRIDVVVADDKGMPELTPVAVDGLLAAGASIISALPGSAHNLAVRELLNTRCVPQIMSLASTDRLGEPRDFPWTMGGLVTDTVETTVYANAIQRTRGEDTMVSLLVSNDDAGLEYASAFTTAAVDAGLTLAGQQVVEPNVIDAPAPQVLTLASIGAPVIVASLTGAACATFLNELARVEAAVPEWRPDVYLASDCADTSLLRLAGAAADGVLTSASLVSDDPAFIETMRAAGVTTGFGRALQGWTAAEVTVAILVRAQQSEAGLTRASIIDAARNLSYVPSLARPGVEYTTNGLVDPFPVESLQIVRYDAANQRFDDVGPLIAQFES
jgi:branched-chain amino acid transport system substrate-binding protein